mgnify:CR=1 FL=1
MESFKNEASRWKRQEEAARRILEVSTELRLTWYDFEAAIKIVKENAQISMSSSNDKT